MNRLCDRLFELANESLKNNEFPVSAIIYDDKFNIIGEGYNCRNKTNVTTDHAEIIAIQKANSTIKSWRLENYNMIVTLEPCEMCKNVIKESRLNKVYYLVQRLDYKKISNKTDIIKLKIEDEINSKKIENYKHILSDFFVDKR